MSDDDATLLIQVPAVDFYSVEGREKTLLGTGDLNVLSVTIDDEAGDAEGKEDAKECHRKVVFFCVGEYTCPLAPHVPALSMGRGYYVFPLPSGFYGVQVPESTDPRIVVMFENVLRQNSLFRSHSNNNNNNNNNKGKSSSSNDSKSGGKGKERSTSVSGGGDGVVAVVGRSSDAARTIETCGNSLSSGIEQSGRLIAGGVAATANQVGQGMSWGTHWLISRIRPRQEPVKVSEKVGGNIGKARQLSGVAVRVSAALVTSVVAMTGQLADTIAEEIKQSDVGKKIDAKISGEDGSGHGENGGGDNDGGDNDGNDSDDDEDGDNDGGEGGKKNQIVPAGGGGGGEGGGETPGRSESRFGGPKTAATATAVKNVAVSTLVAVGEVQAALFQAGVALLDNATTSTADIVTHKYGSEAGAATREGLSVVTDTARAARNMAQVGPKAIAKSTIKKTTANIAIPDEERRAIAVGEIVETRPGEELTSGVMRSIMSANATAPAADGEGGSDAGSDLGDGSKERVRIEQVDD